MRGRECKISLIIVTYNASPVLQACLDSIYKQSYPNIEIIVIDGASTDGTVEILKNNSHKIDYWVSEPDSGIYEAMNKGIKVSTGDWLLFLGSDDELLSGFSDMATELNEPFSIYYGSVLYKGNKCSGYMTPYKMAKLGMQHQAMFYSKSIFNKHSYDLNYKISADSVLNMQCWRDKSVKWIFKDHIIAKFNHTGISARSEDELLKKNMPNLIMENFGLLIWIRYILRIFKKHILKTANK